MIGLCREFGCLPFAGALLDQPVQLLRWLAIAQMGGEDAAMPDADPTPWAQLAELQEINSGK